MRRIAESHGAAAFVNAAISIVIVWLLVLAAAFLPGCGSDQALHSGHVDPAAPPCWLDEAAGLLFCAGPVDHDQAELACEDAGGDLADPSDPSDPMGIDQAAWDALSAGAAELGPRVWTGWPPVTPSGWTGCAVWSTDQLSGHASAMPGSCDERLPFACEVSDGLE